MGSGLPVVASDVGGNNEIVKEGENGFLIQGDDVDTLGDQLVKLIDDEGLRQRMGRRGRELAQQYDWKNIMGQYDELYRQFGNE